MVVAQTDHLGGTAMRTNTCTRSLGDVLSQFLTPQDWRQAHRAWRPKQGRATWFAAARAGF